MYGYSGCILGEFGGLKIANALTGAEKEFDGCGQFGLVMGEFWGG